MKAEEKKHSTTELVRAAIALVEKADEQSMVDGAYVDWEGVFREMGGIVYPFDEDTLAESFLPKDTRDRVHLLAEWIAGAARSLGLHEVDWVRDIVNEKLEREGFWVTGAVAR